ncbi:GNAT family N-acetyltransferase [Novosphingobium sp. TCA1]|uniref:GNAT family N-acetyltransferase n=1 Tax=Novosphingobium pentaromativorans TaxID=205844 RepID=A0A2W5QEM0_9SPHN|nr:GNAT family N-acetyltransferase [Novosphingobium sp. TCA1]PZQ53193.1 MAG: GNAT family N-acetyltransferase [Novosphingobium pentaromativorans]GFE73093.1 N-acetyltransferase [Novosphingobium sp. TCA1]
MNLRLAAAADAAALADLGARSFVAKFGYMYTPEDLADFLADSHSEAKAAKEIADPSMRVFLAEEEGRLLGFCKLVLACGWPDHARGQSVIELKQLYTDPQTTGRGIGTALMDRALEIAREQAADEVQLSVWSGNEGAQRFYARYGFAKVADIYFMVGEQRDDEFLYARMM